MTAARELLDEVHDAIDTTDDDNNAYIFGKIGDHNIVIAGLPMGLVGIASAATVARDMKRSFRQLRFGLMVGIGGGIPTCADVRLGDIVVSIPNDGHGGVVQWDFGIATDNKFVRTGFLNAPPSKLLNHVQLLRSDADHGDKIRTHLKKFDTSRLGGSFLYQGLENDQLFENDIDHIQENDDPAQDTCNTCKELGHASLKRRKPRTNPGNPEIYYGTILSGNQVVRDANLRDEWGRKENGICFEMEAAGLMQNFPCLVVRGICNYSDSHKNTRWEPYAAATAAAYAKALLLQIPPRAVQEIPLAFQDAPVQQGYHLSLDQLPQIGYPQTNYQPQYHQQAILFQNGNLAGPLRQPQIIYASPASQPQYLQAYQQPQAFPIVVQNQAPPEKDYAELMVENGRGLDRPSMTDPLPQNAGGPFVTDFILRMRGTSYWNWAQEHKVISDYVKYQNKRMDDEHALIQAKRFHGLS